VLDVVEREPLALTHPPHIGRSRKDHQVPHRLLSLARVDPKRAASRAGVDVCAQPASKVVVGEGPCPESAVPDPASAPRKNATGNLLVHNLDDLAGEITLRREELQRGLGLGVLLGIQIHADARQVGSGLDPGLEGVARHGLRRQLDDLRTVRIEP
jgi:hypothetical protein